MITIEHKGEKLELEFVEYIMGGSGIVAYTEDGDIYGNLTTNVGPQNRGYWLTIDTNNYPNMDKTLLENNILDELITEVQSGFCMYPVYQLSDQYIDILEND